MAAADTKAEVPGDLLEMTVAAGVSLVQADGTAMVAAGCSSLAGEKDGVAPGRLSVPILSEFSSNFLIRQQFSQRCPVCFSFPHLTIPQTIP